MQAKPIMVQQNSLMQIRTRIHWMIPNQHILVVQQKFDGVSLNRTSSTKFLGVIIDENFTLKNHIDSISKTVSRNVGMLTKLKHFVLENILYSLHCTLILPYIWDNTSKTYLDKIFKLQKIMGHYDNRRYVRLICLGVDILFPPDERFRPCKQTY